MFLTQLFWNSNTYLSLVSKKNLKKFCKGSVWNSPLIHKCLNEFIIILCYVHFVYKHGLWTPREEIAFTARPKIQSQSQIFRYSRSIFCLPHRPNFSDIFDLCLYVRSPWQYGMSSFQGRDEKLARYFKKIIETQNY